MKKKTCKRIILCAVIALFICAAIFFVAGYFDLHKSGIIPFSRYRFRVSDPLYDAYTTRVLTSADIDLIRGWMTFRYINMVFKLPSNYLSDVLHIDDARYPNSIVYNTARRAGESEKVYVEKVKNAVRQYYIQNKSE